MKSRKSKKSKETKKILDQLCKLHYDPKGHTAFRVIWIRCTSYTTIQMVIRKSKYLDQLCKPHYDPKGQPELRIT